jgi:hypothetical protein
MRKLIKIYLENNQIEFEDESEEKIKNYTSEFTKFFSQDNVLFIETSFGEYILVRPSKISAIKISEVKN